MLVPGRGAGAGKRAWRWCWVSPVPTHKGEALHGRANTANPTQAFSHLPQDLC